jgi:tellurite methyltransferase
MRKCSSISTIINYKQMAEIDGQGRFHDLYATNKFYYGSPSDGLIQAIKNFPIQRGIALDIGAGEGRNSIYLANQGFEVYAVEPAPSGAKTIREYSKLYGLDIRVTDKTFLDADLNACSFNFIVSVTSLDHMPLNKIADACLKINHILAPSGVLYAVVFTTEDPGAIGDVDHSSECAKLVTHYFRPGELRERFSNLRILHYSEYLKDDFSHGKSHKHGKAKIIASKQLE